MKRERRQTQRLDCLSGGKISYGDETLGVLIHDLTVKGCRITSVVDLKVGGELDLTLGSGRFVNPLTVRCRVIWSDPIESSNQRQYGLLFREFANPEDRQALMAFLAQERMEVDALSGYTFGKMDAAALSQLDPLEAQKMGSLVRLSRFLNRSHKLEEVARAVVDSVVRIMAPERALFLLHVGGRELELLAAHGLHQSQFEECAGHHPGYSKSVVNKVLDSRTPALSIDVSNETALEGAESLLASGTRSILCVPLIASDDLLGVLYIDSPLKAAFSYGDLEVARVLGEMATAAVERAQYTSLLVQNEKMSALGTLVASLAHELNNPLTAIQGVADCLEDDTDPELVEILQAQVKRCTELVRRLTNWSHKEEVTPEPVTAAAVWKATEPLVGPQLRTKGVELVNEMEEGLPNALAQVNALSQVLVNLINNSAAALKGRQGGKIVLSWTSSEDTLTVKVRDNGPGIPPHLLDRIFDPFFTTKEKGEGTGLGLSICRRIMLRFDGSLTVRNLPQGGAQFTMRVPLAEPGANPFPDGEKRE